MTYKLAPIPSDIEISESHLLKTVNLIKDLRKLEEISQISSDWIHQWEDEDTYYFPRHMWTYLQKPTSSVNK